jgi:8-oxo-dGTP pyrophosphatase MutT (NUDIX family)
MTGNDQDRVVIRAACAVAYRLNKGQLEFCLLLVEGDSRWEFPHGPLQEAEEMSAAAVRLASDVGGLQCRLTHGDSLGEFRFGRDRVFHHVTAFLMQLVIEDEDWPGAINRKRRWFLPEEARARIRRKPMRYLAVLAQRLIDISGP